MTRRLRLLAVYAAGVAGGMVTELAALHNWSFWPLGPTLLVAPAVAYLAGRRML